MAGRLNGRMWNDYKTRNPDAVLGYRPTCACNREDWIPGLLLDPFLGSGTTALVARELGLRCVGLDLSGTYLKEQAAVRVLDRTPEGALEDLPLFAPLRDPVGEMR